MSYLNKMKFINIKCHLNQYFPILHFLIILQMNFAPNKAPN